MVTDSSPHTLRKILRSWPLAEQRRFFEVELGVPLKLEPDTGKLFPVSDRARDVRDALIEAARRQGVELLFGTTVSALEPPARGDATGSWRVGTSAGPLEARAVVLATGGLSVPKTGSDGIGLAIARRLGHAVRATYPALTPLTLEPPRFAELSGISLTVTLRASPVRSRGSTRGGFLFTHRGYSGPAVLDLSHLAVRALEDPRGSPPLRLLVQWTDLDRQAWESELAPRGAPVAGVLARHLPARLARALQREADVPEDRSLAQLRGGERRRLVAALTEFELPWSGHEGYRKAEVTGGGVDLAEIDPRTLESRRHAGLHLCGEMLDAFGPIGGYNFAWAWVTGRAAGIGAARRDAA
jgi:predicted Rossmann fold flavoprotein